MPAASIELCANLCGAKCCRAPGHMMLTPTEMRRLKKLDPKVKMICHDKNNWVMNFKGEDCVFLKDNLCTIYDERPSACRRFPRKAYYGCLVWPRVL